MRDVSLYDLSTGRILRTMRSDEETILLNTPAGAGQVDGIWPSEGYFVRDGEPVAIPAAPGDWAVWDWPSKSWTDPRDAAWHAAEHERLLGLLRLERDVRLTACDWSQLLDAPLTPEALAAWRVYRQALRDLPDNTADPASPVWPTPPTA